MGTPNEELDDGLTPEERAALNEDDGSGDPDAAAAAAAEEEGGTDNENEGQGNDENPDGAGADAQDGAAGAADDAANAADDQYAVDSPGRDDGQPAVDPAGQPEGTQGASAPILVAEVPADAEAKLQEIATAKADLLTKFDDGDLTAKEYQSELDKLAKQEREIERAIFKAEIAADAEKQRQVNEWHAAIHRFMDANPIYKPDVNPRLYRALDQEIRDLATSKEGEGLTYDQTLRKAHENLAKAFNLQPAKAEQKPAAAEKKPVPKPELPPTLAKVPAADTSETGGNKWAALDRLLSSDPIAYEEALAQLSDSDRAAYLAAA